MKQTFTGTDYVWAHRAKRHRLPINYNYGVQRQELDYWATASGRSVSQLHRATERVLRRCHDAAVLRSAAIQNYPEVYQLGVGVLVVYYTVERETIVVRGYSPNQPPDQTEEEISGGYYCDISWERPTQPGARDRD